MPLAYKKRVRQGNQDVEDDTNQAAQDKEEECDEITRYRFALRPYFCSSANRRRNCLESATDVLPLGCNGHM
jgi:hypothetical protein